MKTIERLRELLGKCKFGTTKATCEEGDMSALLSKSPNALPALLAVVEAAEAYMLEENPAKWRDQRAKLFESVAAFRAMEGGA